MDDSIEYFNEWKSNKTENYDSWKMSRSIVFCTALRHGSSDDLKLTLDIFDLTNDTNLKRDIFTGLACSNEILEKLMNDHLNKSDILGFLNNINDTCLQLEEHAFSEPLNLLLQLHVIFKFP